MAANAENVLVAVGGTIWVDDASGATLPTTATASPSGFAELGYLSEDGFTESTDVDSDEIVAWQEGVIVRRTITSQTKTFELTFIETKADVLRFVRPGSTLTGTDANYSMTVAPISATRKAMIFDILDGTRLIRKVVANCEITDFGDVEYKNGEPIGYQVTVTAYPDDSGFTYYEYSDDATVS